jgi:hypothetical protein
MRSSITWDGLDITRAIEHLLLLRDTRHIINLLTSPAVFWTVSAMGTSITRDRKHIPRLSIWRLILLFKWDVTWMSQPVQRSIIRTYSRLRSI